LLALVAASVLGASSADAAIMVATAGGDFNDLAPYFTDWNVTVTYDTSKGLISDTASGHEFHWDSSFGTPSPILGIHTEVSGDAGAIRDLSGATAFDITLEPTVYFYSITGPTYSIAFGYGIFSPLAPPDTDLSFNANYYHSFFSYFGEVVLNGVNADPAFNPPDIDTYDDYLSVSRTSLPVPETGTWAMLTLGFFGIGGLLRRRAIARSHA